MKVKNWFFYSKIFNPVELFQGITRIIISYMGKHFSNVLPGLRAACKKLRWNFTIEKIRWLDGIDVFVYTASSMYEAMLRNGGFDRDEFDFLKQNLQVGDVFIDVGANIGLYTVFAARVVGKEGKVLSFEPSGREFELLEYNINYNKFTNVNLYRMALSNRNGKANFLVSGGNATDVSTLSNNLYNDKVTVEKVEEVEVRTLDWIVENVGLKKINIIKVDAEGYDLFVLEGAKNSITTFKPLILLEVSPQNLQNAGCKKEDLFNLVKSMDYNIYYFGVDRKLTMTPPPYTINPRNSYFNIVCYPK